MVSGPAPVPFHVNSANATGAGLVRLLTKGECSAAFIRTALGKVARIERKPPADMCAVISAADLCRRHTPGAVLQDV